MADVSGAMPSTRVRSPFLIPLVLYEADIDVMNAAHPSAEDLRKTLAHAIAAIVRAQDDAQWALDDFPAEQRNVRAALQDALAASRKAHRSMLRVELDN